MKYILNSITRQPLLRQSFADQFDRSSLFLLLLTPSNRISTLDTLILILIPSNLRGEKHDILSYTVPYVR